MKRPTFTVPGASDLRRKKEVCNDEYILPPADFRRDAELKWDAFAEAKRTSIEDPDNQIAARLAARLHEREFMKAFTREAAEYGE